MALYYEVGRSICIRTEKGVAVMDAEYLQGRYLDRQGFSPRNLRRVRAYYEEYDLLIGMDQENLRNMYRICGGDISKHI